MKSLKSDYNNPQPLHKMFIWSWTKTGFISLCLYPLFRQKAYLRASPGNAKKHIAIYLGGVSLLYAWYFYKMDPVIQPYRLETKQNNFAIKYWTFLQRELSVYSETDRLIDEYNRYTNEERKAARRIKTKLQHEFVDKALKEAGHSRTRF